MSSSTPSMRRSQIKVADAASYTINTFKRSTKLADRVSKARNDANEDRSRAARIRSHSPTRRFATLHGSDPRPLYPSSHECPDSVNSEFIRLIRRAQDTLDAAKPDIEAEEHLTAALSQIELQSDQILGEMGYVDTYTEPVVATKCWLSAPNTHDHVRREVSFYFSKNSVPFTPPATDDNPEPSEQLIPLEPVLATVPIHYDAQGWKTGPFRCKYAPSWQVELDRRIWYKPP